MSEWRMLPVAATPEMKRAAVVYANGNAVYKNVAAEALEIEEDIYGEVYDAMIAAAPPAPTSTQYPLPDDLYDSKDWRSGGYAERVEWLHTMYENAKATLDTYLEMQAAPSAEPRELAALLRRAVAALSEWHADHGIPDADATLMHDIRCAIDHRRIEPTTECTTCGAIVVGVAEPSEPVAFYVQRVAPGKRDDGMRLGPWWRKEDAEEWVDERHVLRELHAHPAPAEPTAACVEAMREMSEPVATLHDDGHWTHPRGRDPLDQFSGRRSLDVYAAPPALPDGAVEAMRMAANALRVAVTQHEHDMLLTGEECRAASAAIEALRAQIEQIGGGR